MGTWSLSRRDLRLPSFFRRDFFPDSSSSRRTDAKGDGLALGSPVGRNNGLIGSRRSSMISASGISPFCCACLIFIASFEGFEGTEKDADLVTDGGFCEEVDLGRDCADVVETGEGVDLDSSVGGNEGGRPETPRGVSLPNDWYEVVIAVVAVGPFPIGVTNLVRVLCSWASGNRDRRDVADGGRTQETVVSGLCFALDCASNASLDGPRAPCCWDTGRGVSVAVDDPSSVDLPDDCSGLTSNSSKRSCSIAASTARRTYEESDVEVSEGANSEFREKREAWEGRRMGYVRMEALSTANDRELIVRKLLALYIVDLEPASSDSLDFFGVPTMLFSIGGGGIVVTEGGRASYWSYCGSWRGG